jgi:serine/threonine protein kinase/TPR repeat protein
MPTAERYHQYQILRREDGSLWELGRGAMGITYKAFDTNLRFTVALKVINSAYLDSETARQRFLREARAAAGLQHPNVAAVFNLGTEQDKFYYVMEYIDGETVDARVKRLGPLEPLEALNIALQVARALAVAAKQQLVHRDLKPTNLMLVDQEGESMVKVIDFGLAKVAKDSGEDSATLTIGGFVGTPHFASPEQVEEGEVDIRSDIYSLGATLYFVLTGQSPFSGSVGQVMSQHLYKPLPMERLTALPRSVVSLLQQMMEKDRNNRPQTPQDLQKIILACLEEIRASESRRAHKPDEQNSTFETLDLGLATGQPLAVGEVLAQKYKLINELPESPPGRRFLADDLRRQRRVSLLVLSPEFLSDGARLANLEEAVQRLQIAPHPMMREIYSFETSAGCSFLVEEYVLGPSLLDLIRTRSVLSAPEVLRLLRLLAPLVDHATNYQLQHLDLTLSGIHLTPPASTESETRQEFLQRPLTAWSPFEAKVDAIDFSFLPSDSATWAGSMTRTGGASGGGTRSSCVRMLSLLAYELLGGPRTKLDSTGQYTPIAALTQEGNLTLRRALVDECPSAGNLVEQLAAVIGTKGPAPPLAGTRAPTEPLPRVPPPRTPVDAPPKRKMTVTWLRLVLAIGLAALLGIGSYAIYQFTAGPPTAEIVELSVRSEPTGASVLLDGKPPQEPPGTFTHVDFGKHQLSVSLAGYLPITRDIQVQTGMNPTIPVILQPIPPPVEIAALTIKTEPTGASVLLDGKPPQQPPGTFTHVGFGKHQLGASLDGYLPITRDIQVQTGMDPTISVILQPIPPPIEIAALTIKTEPAGASVLLDGKPPQQPPGTFTHVGFGKHQLSASLDGYLPITRDIQVRTGTNPTLSVILVPIPPPVEITALTVKTEPAGALVLLDGKPPQQPPGTFTHVPFGKYQLTASANGYESVNREVLVREGMDAEISLILPAIKEIAALTIKTEPAGASVLLNGKPPQQSPNTFTHVPFGKYQLAASLDGYLPFTRDIQVNSGMNPTIPVILNPLPPPVEIASLTVTTDPAGASVLLDGKLPQQPPATFTHVPFGRHPLTAFLVGHEPVTQDLQVREQMEPTLTVKLPPADEGSPQYLTAYVQFVQSLKTSGATNFAEHLEKLESIIDLLHNRASPLTSDEFRLFYKKSITDAANMDLDVLPAMLLLGENASNDSEAIKWFEYAVNRKNDSYAMMKLGRLYLKKGTSDDSVKGHEAKGYELLRQAYEKGNLEAGAYMGECLLYGLGTKQDWAKGEKLITVLANQNQVQSMVILGGIRQGQADYKRSKAKESTEAVGQGLNAEAGKLESEARQWWEKSAAKGNYYALAHLGQMMEKGIGGYEKNEEEAEKRYKEGIRHGNPLSMFYYGLMLGKKPDRQNESETWIGRAAAMGLAAAISWLGEHHLPIPEKKTDN